jgi:hypothetical protein
VPRLSPERFGVCGTLPRVLSTAEIRFVQSSGLAGRETRFAEYFDNHLGENALFRWNRGRVSLPTKLRADVLVQSRIRACDLVCAAMQVAYLIEEGFELGLVERAHGYQVWRGIPSARRHERFERNSHRHIGARRGVADDASRRSRACLPRRALSSS